MAEIADVRPVKFYTKFVPNSDGTFREVDWVDYARRGDAKFQVTPEAWRRLPEAVKTALLPHYEAWKNGRKPLESGTPLDAWRGLDENQIEIIRSRDVHSIEDLAALTDSQRDRIGLPGMVTIQQGAKRFLEAQQGNKVETALAAKDEQIAALQSQMADLMALVSGKVEARDHDDEPVKRRPGRPRRDDADTTEAA